MQCSILVGPGCTDPILGKEMVAVRRTEGVREEMLGVSLEVVEGS